MSVRIGSVDRSRGMRRRDSVSTATVGSMSQDAPNDAVDPIDTGADALLTSPLHDAHVALGATMAPFGGWEMPISYAGGGVVAEHTAVREAVGLFDVSHLGKATVTGPGAAAFVNRCLSADLGQDRPRPGAVHACAATTPAASSTT